MNLEAKIIELFFYRKIPDLISISGLSKDEVMPKMMTLQKAIFEYDKYLEEQWELDQKIVYEKWQIIKKELSLWYLNGNSIDHELEQIAIYAKNEHAIRSGLSLSSIPIRYFYYYKSCDVRLMRRLIQYSSQEKWEHGIEHWMGFDWITEINDDLSDIEEDRNTFNGNRFIHVVEKNGLTSAKLEYAHFLEEVETQIYQTKITSNQIRRIVEWGEEELDMTRALLSSIKEV